VVTLALILVLAWLLTALAVLGLARLLGRASTSPTVTAPAPEPAAAPPHNVVALLARPRNDLVRSGEAPQRRAA
jgi:hypothetical protein